MKVDVDAAEMGNNRRAAAALCGDGSLVVAQLAAGLRESGWKGYSRDHTWFRALLAKVANSTKGLEALMADEKAPMSYYRAFRDIHGLAPRDAIIVTEGANTMDIGRGASPQACLLRSCVRACVCAFAWTRVSVRAR